MEGPPHRLAGRLRDQNVGLAPGVQLAGVLHAPWGLGHQLAVAEQPQVIDPRALAAGRRAVVQTLGGLGHHGRGLPARVGAHRDDAGHRQHMVQLVQRTHRGERRAAPGSHRAGASDQLLHQTRLVVVAHEGLRGQRLQPSVRHPPAQGPRVGRQVAVVAPRRVSHEEVRAGQVVERKQPGSALHAVDVHRPLAGKRPIERSIAEGERLAGGQADGTAHRLAGGGAVALRLSRGVLKHQSAPVGADVQLLVKPPVRAEAADLAPRGGVPALDDAVDEGQQQRPPQGEHGGRVVGDARQQPPVGDVPQPGLLAAALAERGGDAGPVGGHQQAPETRRPVVGVTAHLHPGDDLRARRRREWGRVERPPRLVGADHPQALRRVLGQLLRAAGLVGLGRPLAFRGICARVAAGRFAVGGTGARHRSIPADRGREAKRRARTLGFRGPDIHKHRPLCVIFAADHEGPRSKPLDAVVERLGREGVQIGAALEVEQPDIAADGRFRCLGQAVGPRVHAGLEVDPGRQPLVGGQRPGYVPGPFGAGDGRHRPVSRRGQFRRLGIALEGGLALVAGQERQGEVGKARLADQRHSRPRALRGPDCRHPVLVAKESAPVRRRQGRFKGLVDLYGALDRFHVPQSRKRGSSAQHRRHILAEGPAERHFGARHMVLRTRVLRRIGHHATPVRPHGQALHRTKVVGRRQPDAVDHPALQVPEDQLAVVPPGDHLAAVRGPGPGGDRAGVAALQDHLGRRWLARRRGVNLVNHLNREMFVRGVMPGLGAGLLRAADRQRKTRRPNNTRSHGVSRS